MDNGGHNKSAGGRLRLRIASRPLQYLLEVANSLPRKASGDTETPVAPSPREDARAGGFREAYQKQWLGTVKKVITDWGAPARKYVLKDSAFEKLDERYCEVIAVSDLLNRVADFNHGRTKSGDLDEGIDLPESMALLSTIKLRLRGSRRSSGALEGSGLLQMLLGCGDLDRVKRCEREKCGKLFFAGRISNWCCSEPCRNAYKQMRHREREKQNRIVRKVLKRGKRNG